MKELRLLGSTIQKLAQENQVNEERLGAVFNCASDQIAAIFDGRVFPAYEELEAFAELVRTDLEEMLRGDEAFYDKNVVHYMGMFADSEKREEVLDIFDDYLTLLSATGG